MPELKGPWPWRQQDKIKYAEYVSMTEPEYHDLITRSGSEELVKYGIEILNSRGANGKTCKSDYLALLRWIEDCLAKEKERN